MIIKIKQKQDQKNLGIVSVFLIFVLIFYNNETFPSRNFEGPVSTVILLTLIITAGVDNTELHIYGSGDFEEELKKYVTKIPI